MVSILVVVLVMVIGGIWVWNLVAGDLPLIYATTTIH